MPAQMFTTNGTMLSQVTPGHIGLEEGGVFTKVAQNTEIKTPLATVQADKGAIVSVRSGDGEIRVQACGGGGKVHVVANGQSMELNPGTELILADHEIQSVGNLANDGVARREVTPVSFGDKVKGVVNEFSMVSLLGQMQAVKSPETPY